MMQKQTTTGIALTGALALVWTHTVAFAGEAEVRKRYDAAAQNLRSRDFGKSTEEYVWLWKNIEKEDPSMTGVRSSFMLSNIHELVQEYQPARQQFSELRDYAATHNRSDWISLNSALDEDDKTLDWFDRIKKDEAEANTLASEYYLLEPLLIKRGTWADIILLYPDPMKALNREHEIAKESSVCNRFPQHAATIYTALLAAGRDNEADQIAKRAIMLEDSKLMRRNLLMCAAMAKQTRPNQLVWIIECEELKSGPAGAKGYYARGIAYEKYRQWEASIKEFDQAIKFDPNYTAAYFERGRANRAIKHLEPAKEDFDQVIRLDSQNVQALVRRAGVQMELNQYEEGLQDALAALKINPNYSPAYNLSGRYKLAKNDYAAALQDLDKAIELEPRYPDAFLNRASAYEKLKQYDRAVDNLNQCISLDPQRPEALMCRARILHVLGKDDACIRDCNAAIQLDPRISNGEPYYYRAVSYEKLGKSDQARLDKAQAHSMGFKPATTE